MSPAGRDLLVRQEAVMGTVVSLTVAPGDLGMAAVDAALAEAVESLHEAERIFSPWIADSPLSRLRRREITLGDAPPVLAEVLDTCRHLREATGGWFDPWAMPGGVDPSGMVKGWAAAGALARLCAAGLPGAAVNAGGDVALHGSPAPGQPWRIGIRHPWRPEALAGIVEPPGAVATSGLYERGLHLVDPFDGSRPCRVASASVTGPSLAVADALATAAAVAGAAILPLVAALAGYAAAVVLWDGTEVTSPDFPWARDGFGHEGDRPGGPGEVRSVRPAGSRRPTSTLAR